MASDMAASVPTTEPATLVAGDTWTWSKSLADYSAADGWVLRYTLVNTAERISFDAAASGSDHLVTVAATSTANYPAGTYDWRSQVLLSGQVFTVGRGQMVIESPFGSAIDARTSSRIALDNLNAYLEDPANLKAASYQIGDRQLARYRMSELLALRSRLQAEVAREEAALATGAGLADKRRTLVAFR